MRQSSTLYSSDKPSAAACARGAGGGERCVEAKERAAGWRRRQVAAASGRRACEHNARTVYSVILEAAAADAAFSSFCAPCHARHPIMAATVTPCATTRARMNNWLCRRLPSANDWERVRRGLRRRKNKKDSEVFGGRNPACVGGGLPKCGRLVLKPFFRGATTPHASSIPVNEVFVKF